jgi:hypothetical protein
MPRKTIASLEGELSDQRRLTRGFQDELNQFKANAHGLDGEARAIAGCVAALDRVVPVSHSWQQPQKVQRILRFLADRYGVTWHEAPMLNGGYCPPQGISDFTNHND